MAEQVWQIRGELTTGRTLHTTTALEGGASVLVVGGYDESGYLDVVERYSSALESSETRAALEVARHSHTADRLLDGSVLVVGGYGDAEYLASAERYDPVTDEWRAVGSMGDARIGHASVVLPDGRVLVVGGYNDSGLVATAELFDPLADAWVSAGAMSSSRARHSATVLSDGTVLIAGGFVDEVAVDLVERFDPDSMSFGVAAPLAHARWFHSAVRLADDTVWIVGGQDELGALVTSELFDPVDGSIREGPILDEPRTQASVTAFEDVANCGDQVVLMGGFSGALPGASSVTLDPVDASLGPPLSMSVGRFEQTHARLDDCSIAVFGGRTSSGFAVGIDRLVELSEGSGGAGSGGGDSGANGAGGWGGGSDGDGCSCSMLGVADLSGLPVLLFGLAISRIATSRRARRA